MLSAYYKNKLLLPMSQNSTQKQIVHWNIQTLNHLSAIVDLVHRKEQSEPINSYDFKLRDFFFRPNFQLFRYRDTPSFIDKSSQWITHFTAYNQLAFLQSVSFENQMQKHRFWNNVYDMYVKSKKDQQNRSIVRNIVWTYRLIPITFFLFGGATILRFTGVYKMSPKKQIVGLVAATIFGDFFVRAKMSSNIFYLIPPLSDQRLQKERLQILNKSIVLDGKINQIEFHPTYVNELIEQADKQQNYEQKKLILETAGYIVVDKIDFQY